MGVIEKAQQLAVLRVTKETQEIADKAAILDSFDESEKQPFDTLLDKCLAAIEAHKDFTRDGNTILFNANKVLTAEVIKTIKQGTNVAVPAIEIKYISRKGFLGAYVITAQADVEDTFAKVIAEYL